MRCQPVVTVLVLLLPASGLGHKDLAGQVHPIVQATTDGFDVYFTNNVMRPFTRSTHPDCLEIDDPRDFRFREDALFREHVSRAGVRTKPEPVCAQHRDHSPDASAAWMERLQGPWAYERDTMVSPEVRPLVHEISGPTGKRRHKLLFDAREHVAAGGADVGTWRVVLVSAPDETIRLLALPRDSAGLGPEAALGKAAHVYMFARASNLVAAHGKVHVAWIDSNKHLKLSSWTPDGGLPSTETIGPVQSNTSLSAAVNGNDLLIAWHEPGDKGEGAVIKVVHHELR